MPLAIVVSGMVSTVQGDLAGHIADTGIPTIGFYDGFQPPGPDAISVKVSGNFDEIWVPTETVREGFQALGLEAMTVGSPPWKAGEEPPRLWTPGRFWGARAWPTGTASFCLPGSTGQGIERCSNPS
jgi:hypothetical protein